MFSSPRSTSSRSSLQQPPTSPPYPPSPHPELVASPKSLAADVFERVARSRPYSRSSSITPSSSTFPKGIFPRPESSLYYTASLKSFGSVQPDQGENESFGGELSTGGTLSAAATAPTTTSNRGRATHPQPAASGGVLSALLESTRRRGGLSREAQFNLQRHYTTEAWVRGGFQQPHTTTTNWYNYDSPDEDHENLEEHGGEDEGEGNTRKGHRRRNHSNAKTITQADIANILQEATPIPPELDEERGTGEYSSDNDAYLFYRTAPQSMAETVRTNTPFMPDMRKSPFKGVEEEVINRSESTASSQCNGTATPTLASIHLAPLNPPTRTPSRTSIKWNGRSVFISIPLDIRDDDGVDPASGRPPAWTKEQVLERLRKWEKLGYNIEARDAFESNGQSKEIYPEERIGPFDKSEVIVSIPDRRGEIPQNLSL